jgi:hypothetical protein
VITISVSNQNISSGVCTSMRSPPSTGTEIRESGMISNLIHTFQRLSEVYHLLGVGVNMYFKLSDGPAYYVTFDGGTLGEIVFLCVFVLIIYLLRRKEQRNDNQRIKTTRP